MTEVVLDSLNHYNLEDISISDNIANPNSDRGIFVVDSSRGKFVAKVSDTKTLEETIKRDLHGLEYLEKKEFPSPRMFMNKSGSSYIESSGRYVYIMEYIEGEKPEHSVENYFKLGQLGARLHNYDDYDLESSFDVVEEVSSLGQSDIPDQFKEDFLRLLGSLPDFTLRPPVLIHTDLGLHNVIKNDRGDLVLINIGGNNSKAEGSPDNYISTPEEYRESVRNLFSEMKPFVDKIIFVSSGYIDESKTNPKISHF